MGGDQTGPHRCHAELSVQAKHGDHWRRAKWVVTKGGQYMCVPRLSSRAMLPLYINSGNGQLEASGEKVNTNGINLEDQTRGTERHARTNETNEYCCWSQRGI
eukprot:scaffold93265_cov17-Tisochrysis_lutea.AAC.1